MWPNMHNEYKDWARETLNSLDEEDRNLIRQATSDLFYGPLAEDGYPGFERACKEIRKAVDPWIFNASVTSDDTGEECLLDAKTAKRALLGTLAEYI